MLNPLQMDLKVVVKLTFNTVKLEDALNLIDRIVFASGFVNNFNDPFILCLNLKTNSNFKCLNKVAKILHSVFGNRLLDNTFTYQSQHVMTTKIKELR